MKMRPIQKSTEGRFTRDKVRVLLKAVHVLELGPAQWEVRTLGERGTSKLFQSKAAAVEYAAHLRPDSKVVVHHRKPKKVTFARMTRSAGRGVSIREEAIR
ncbi:MAG TPA: hypothetical protein VEW48_21345 [Thermoanaerobaculia bacterium]|nr:hypothetical protein [Thermoanaerobaculia bacterium]